MSKTNSILIVDDDRQILGVLRALLEAEGYAVTQAADGAEMLRALATQTFDLITLDLGLPDASGIELARDLCRNSDIPIIVVSGRGDDYDRVIALELGADDFVAKPFNTRELAARVRAVLRRCNGARGGQSQSQAAAGIITFHHYRLNTQSRELRSLAGTKTSLTSAECRLLQVLLSKAGRVCTRDEITAQIKGREWSPLDRSLDTLVARVRRKIEPNPAQPALLMSVRGVGYMMTVAEQRG